MSDFFEPPPARFTAEMVPHEEWMGPERGELPSVVPVERMVAQTNEVAIYVSGFWVYAAGFEFEVRVIAKDEENELDPFGIEHRMRIHESVELTPELLRLGFEFSDGSKVTNTGASAEARLEGLRGKRPQAPVMDETGGGSTEGTWSQEFWVWPLPPAGSFDLVCEWPAADIPLTRTSLEAAPIIEAASRAQRPFQDS
ncbi:MAG TPA: hypothetical protein VF009_09230 [Solirubrobacterales bacterium]